jgi:hypothetical protein
VFRKLRAQQVLPCVLVLLAASLRSGHARAQQALPKEGRFGAGISVTPLALGPMEVFSAGGQALGVRLWGGVEIGLGSRWALRLPLVLAAASGGTRKGYSEIDIVPGVLYRFRSSVDERFTPYVGAGVKLGGFGADRPLLGKPLLGTVQQALDLDHHSSHHTDDPDFETSVTVGGELWLGASWHLGRLFSLDAEMSASLVPVSSVVVVALAQTLAGRVTF